MLRHGGARVLITDREFSATVASALALLDDKPLVIDIDDPDGGRRRAARRDDLRGVPGGGRSGRSPGQTRRTNGTRSRSTTPPARPAIRRAWSTTIAARYLNAVSNIARLGHAARTRCISGRCRCSTATAGASPGPMAERAGTNVCLRRVEGDGDLATRSATTASRTCAARRSSTRPLINAPDGAARGHRSSYRRPGRRRRAAGGHHRGGRRGGHRPHACLRPDRDLRPGRASVAKQTDVDRAAARRPRRAQRPPGRARRRCRRR